LAAKKAEKPEGPIDGKLLRFKIEGDRRVFEIDPGKLTFNEQELIAQWYPGRAVHEVMLDPVLFQIALLRLAVLRKDEGLSERIGELDMDKLDVIERPTKQSPPSGDQS
jgi:hypothetical protein